MNNIVIGRIIKGYGRLFLIVAIIIVLSFFVFTHFVRIAYENQRFVTPNTPVVGESVDTLGTHSFAKEYVSPFQEVQQMLSREELSQEDKDFALYGVEYIVTWSKETHPEWYPRGAHTSPLVLWSHVNQNNHLFKDRVPASRAVEIVAETGITGEIEKTIETLQSTRNIAEYRIGKKIDVPGTNSMYLKVEKGAPLISAISMIAPSPDWFVAIESVNLYNNSEWIKNIQVPLTLYDAGTDSGTSFNARNANTPQGTYRIITKIEDVTTPLGFIRFTLFSENVNEDKN